MKVSLVELEWVASAGSGARVNQGVLDYESGVDSARSVSDVNRSSVSRRMDERHETGI